MQETQQLRQIDVISKRLSVLRPEDAKAAIGFIDWLKARGIKERRALKYASQLRKLSDMLGKPFDEVTKADINEVVLKIRQSAIAESYKYDLLFNLRYFYKWRLGEGKRIPELVEDIVLKRPKAEVLNPNKLLTSEDIDTLIKATSDLQMKALIAVVLASGARIDEILTLKCDSVFTAADGTHGLVVNGKTGERRIPLKEPRAERLLSDWLEAHPNKEGPLWLDSWGRALQYAALRRRFKRLVVNTTIDKFTKGKLFHLFRHSRATDLGATISDGGMKYYFGWTQGSSMLDRYKHPNESYVATALNELYPQSGPKKEVQELSDWLQMQKKLFEHREVFEYFFDKAREFGYIDDHGRIMPNEIYKNGSAEGEI